MKVKYCFAETGSEAARVSQKVVFKLRQQACKHFRNAFWAFLLVLGLSKFFSSAVHADVIYKIWGRS